MDASELDCAAPESIEQKLASLVSPEFRGFKKGHHYEAACLLAEVYGRFEVRQGRQSLLGHSGFTKWAEGFCKAQGISHRTLLYYRKPGTYLAPLVTPDQFDNLTVKKRQILATLKEAGRLTPEFLQDALDVGITDDELQRRADPLLGKVAPWEEGLIIDSHEGAEAALIQLGNLLDYSTYTADPGRTFQARKLREIATLPKLPPFLVAISESAKRIDVVWIKDERPEFFFEVEHTRTVSESLLRMHQIWNVLRGQAKFFIVAPGEKKHALFLRKMNQSPFSSYKDKYLFRSYADLSEMLRAALKYRGVYDGFFTEPR